MPVSASSYYFVTTTEMEEGFKLRGRGGRFSNAEKRQTALLRCQQLPEAEVEDLFFVVA